MNVALQKRHEQLERWKQNEADNEERVASESQKQRASSRANRSIQQINFGSYPDISSKTDTSRTRDRSSNRSLRSTSKNRGSRRGRLNSELQVKFSDSTLFLTACANGDISECERLLGENLVDIEVTTSDGLTGLHEAAIYGNAQLVEYLIDHGANINCLDYEGWTPLHAAASLGQVKIVEILLDHGADATIVNCENLLAYDLARTEAVRDIIGKYLQDVDIDYLRSQEERAIRKDIERWIQTGHYDERSHPVTNATVLHVLAAKGHVSLMKQILETPILKKQINLEAKDNEGFTPLLAASFWSQKDIVDLLIKHGANIFAQANNGYKISSIHLRNYQECKLQQPIATKNRQSQPEVAEISQETKKSTNIPDKENLDSSKSGPDEGYASSNQSKGQQLSKSRSLDIGQQSSDIAITTITSSMSLDQLLQKSESMSEQELRKSYKELLMENERLKRHLQGFDDRDKQKQQEWIRKERQMQRKISELEEENKQIEQWRQEIQRLKDENSSLIRVVSKLSKQH